MWALNVLTYGHSGDLGDAIVSLASVRSIGGGTYFAMDKPNCRPFIDRMPLLRRLFVGQDYIFDFLPHNGEKIDHDFSTFRDAGHPWGVQLARLHANWVGASPNLGSPWLRVEPSKETKKKIIVSRSGRYRNPHFPWRELVKAFGPKMMFIGLTDEYTSFCSEFGYVDRYVIDDLYDLAAAIAGSERLIANQTASMAICEGLKHKCIQEVCLWVPDCIYPRENAIHCIAGGLKFSALGIDFESEPYEEKTMANIAETPPGGWVLDYKHVSYKSYSFTKVMQVARANFPNEDMHDIIIEQSSTHVPPSQAMSDLRKARELLKTL